MRCKGTAGSSSGHGGDITGGAELSGSMGTATREGNRARGEGRKGGGAHMDSNGGISRLGEAPWTTDDAGDLGCPR